MPPNRQSRLMIQVTSFGALGVTILLYNFDYPLYISLMKHAFVGPFRYPFLDLEYVTAQIRCWRLGVDVYVSNPCDVLGRLHDSSPLWLRMNFIPTDKAWTSWLGLGLTMTFILSLALLPLPSRPPCVIVVMLATLSSLVVFAVERGNVDLLMFIFVALSARLLTSSHSSIRLVGYALILLAGLLKFYPLVVFLLAVRESPARCAGIAIAGLAAIGILVWWYAPEFQALAKNIPSGMYFADRFGAMQLPSGLGAVVYYFSAVLGRPMAPDPQFIIRIVMWALCVLLIAIVLNVLRLLKLADLRTALASLSQGDRVFLISGAALITGCFLTGQNVGYRGVFMLFIPVALLRLADAASNSRLRFQMRATVGAIVFVMWRPTLSLELNHLAGVEDAYGRSSIFFVHWIMQELAWWWIVSVFLAVLIRFLADAPDFRDRNASGSLVSAAG